MPKKRSAPPPTPPPLAPADPHDRFFAFTFGQKEHAIGLLKAALPPALVERLDWETLARQPADFIDPELRWRYSDLLFSIRVRGGEEEVLVYVLVEHQSKPHPLMPWRVLEYVVKAWRDYLEANPRATRLPVIVPLVVHHGEDRWTAPRTLRELFAAPREVIEAAEAHLPQLRFRLIDLRHADADALLDGLLSSFGEVALWAMAAAGDDDVVLEGIRRRFAGALGEVLARPDGRDALSAFLRYILATHEHIDRTALRDAVTEAVSPAAESTVMTMYEQLIEEGRQKGLAEGLTKGLTKGRTEGMAEALLQLLAVRFGRVPAGVRAQVRAGSQTAIRQWMVSAASAKTLDAVFAQRSARNPARSAPKKTARR